MQREKIRDTTIEITNGLLTAVNYLLLFAVFFHLEFELERAEYCGCRARRRKTDRSLKGLGGFGSKTLQTAIYGLKSRGFLKYVKGSGDRKYKITAAGRKRLEALIPFYDEERVWDKKLYLVTYDIVEAKKPDRELLREYLKKLGGGMLQKSVWLTVYDPSEVLRKFIEERGLTASVLVSCLGRGGNIGRESIKNVVARVFDLTELNQRYQEYLDEYRGKRRINRSQAIFAFLSVLRDDPQLPFTLLPPDWQGKKAYRVYKDISSVC